MKILAILFVGSLLMMLGKVEVRAEIMQLLKYDIDLGRKAINRVATIDDKINFEAESNIDSQKNGVIINDDEGDSSGSNSHRLFPDVGKPKYDNPPRRLP